MTNRGSEKVGVKGMRSRMNGGHHRAGNYQRLAPVKLGQPAAG